MDKDFVACSEAGVGTDVTKLIITVPSAAAGLMLWMLLRLVGPYLLRKVKCLQNAPGHFQRYLESWFARALNAVSGICAVALVFDLLYTDYESLLNCADWVSHPFDGHFKQEWLLMLINAFFFQRVFGTFIANNYLPIFVDTVLDTWLFVQSIISLVLKKYFYGFQFLVFHRFLNSYFIETVRYLSKKMHFRTGGEVVLCYIQCVATLCLIAGLVHTAEEWGSVGGFHQDMEGGITSVRDFGEYIYFTVVTLSTVGYGDFSPTTVLGRIVVMVIILTCIPIFAATSGRIVEWFTDLMTRFSSSGSSLQFAKEPPRIVVTGSLEIELVRAFLADFMHPDRNNVAMQVILLGEKQPTRKLNCLMEEYWNASYCMGSPLNRSRLVKLLGQNETCRSSDALMCFADRNSTNQKENDQNVESIVCAAKTTFPDLRIIALVLQSDAKVAIEQIDGWSQRDTVICVNDVTQGLIAQNALSPGSAFVLATLMKANRCKVPTKINDRDEVRAHFVRGQNMEIYICRDAFIVSMPFYVAAEHFYRQGVTLLGARVVEETVETLLFPIVLPQNSFGIFIAADMKQVNNLSMEQLDNFSNERKTSRNKVEYIEDTDERPISVLQLDQSQKNMKAKNVLLRTLEKSHRTVNVIGGNPRDWLDVEKNLRRSSHIIIMNSSSHVSPDDADIMCLRILDRLEKKKRNIEDKIIQFTVNLNNAELMPPSSGSVNVSGGKIQSQAIGDCSIPHAGGTLVSANMTVPMMSAAHHSSDTFKAVLCLIGSETSRTTFLMLRTTKEYTAREVFLDLMDDERLLLGLSVLVEDGSDERMIIVCPPGDMRVTPRDVVIALKRRTDKDSSSSTVEKEIIFKQDIPRCNLLSSALNVKRQQRSGKNEISVALELTDDQASLSEIQDKVTTAKNLSMQESSISQSVYRKQPQGKLRSNVELQNESARSSGSGFHTYDQVSNARKSAIPKSMFLTYSKL